MGDNEIVNKLQEFTDILSLSTLVLDALRSMGWILIRGLAVLIDGLEKVTDSILLTKAFFNNSQVVEFVSTIQPFLYVLLAASFLFTGYLIIFQKKFDREGFLINLFITLLILGLLSPTMTQVSEFSDTAIDFTTQNSGENSSSESISNQILRENIHDLIEYDRNDFSGLEGEALNSLPQSHLRNIDINEVFDSNEFRLGSTGEQISQSKLTWNGETMGTSKLDQSGVEWNNQYYYRYQPNWLTIFVTLGIMGFTLFSIAYKLARLSFELAFNYVLAILVAPADLHSGQKTKKVIQSILNTFLVIILIFVSIKLYTIGTAYLAETLDGFAYLIALIAFSVALIDGPNMVERLFGIDAGLKRGWGVALGAYAAGKGVTSVGAHAVSKVARAAQGAPKMPSLHEAATTRVDSNAMPHNGSTLSVADQASQRMDTERQTDPDGVAQENQTASRTQTDQERPTNPKNDSQPNNGQGLELEAHASPQLNEASGRTSPESIHATNSESNAERGPDHPTTSSETPRPESIHDHSSSGHSPISASSTLESVTGSTDTTSGPDHRHDESVDRNDVTTPTSHEVPPSGDSSSSSSSTTDSNDASTEKRQGRARRTIHQDTVLDVETEVIEQVRENQTHRHSQHQEETRRIYPTSPPRPDNIEKKE
ncbi:pLS20_p028 family conjugation system transmembrane protein [Exiguobacterium alkaliphilum]|uniref:pLS20_p028 family conjugation system transmembrane protein n=1 Tax=Exiguobacterium alkaliphilum TaxID=1428684 RepID=UPI0034644264